MKADKLLNMNEVKSKTFWRALCNEFFSTMFFVVITLGYTVEQKDIASKRGSSVLVGFTVIILVLIGTKKHGYFNPALTVALFIQGRLTLVRVLFFIPVQIIAGLAGVGLIHLLVSEELISSLLQLRIHDDISVLQALGLETFLSFFLSWAVCATIDPARNVAIFPRSLATGFSVASLTYFGLPLTGSGINPVRMAALAVLSNSWKNHWVYWLGPFIGSILGSLFYKYIVVFEEESDEHSKDQNIDTVVSQTNQVFTITSNSA